MALMSSYDPDIMYFKTGGGCIAVFGLPFLLLGLFLTSTVVFSQLSPGAPKSSSQLEVIPICAIFVIIGMVMVFGRAKVAIDKRMQTIRKWWSVIVPIRSKYFKLGDYDKVTLTSEVRRSKNSTYLVYLVKLVGPGGEVVIEETKDYQSQRRNAESLAKFTGFNLIDSTSGKEIVRTPEQLDETVRDRVRRTGKVTEVPPVPEATAINYTIEGQEMQITIPTSPLNRVFGITGMIVGLIPLLFFLFFMQQIVIEDVPMPVKAIIIAVVVIPFGAFFFLLLKFATRKVLLTVSPERLALTEIWSLGKSKSEIPTSELEELEIVTQFHEAKGLEKLGAIFSPDVIVARSDKLSLFFGRGLSSEELKWLHAIIENTVSA